MRVDLVEQYWNTYVRMGFSPSADYWSANFAGEATIACFVPSIMNRSVLVLAGYL